MDISAINRIFDEAKDVIITWFSVLSSGPDAFSRLDLEKSSTLFYSLRFMLYMTFVSYLLHIPTLAKLNSKNAVLVPTVWVVGTFVEYLAPGLILYGSIL